MGRYALRSACREGEDCECGGKHTKDEKKVDKVATRPMKKTTVSTKTVQKGTAKNAQRQKRKTTVGAKATDNSMKDEEEIGVMTRSRRKTMAVALSHTANSDNDTNKRTIETRSKRKTTVMETKETEADKSKTNGRRKTVVSKRKTISTQKITVERKEEENNEEEEEKNEDEVVEREKSVEKEKVIVVENEDVVDNREEDIEWSAEDDTQSIVESDNGDKMEEEKEEEGVKRNELSSIHSPFVNYARRGRGRGRGRIPFEDLLSSPTPSARQFEEELNGTRRGGEWDTTEEEMEGDMEGHELNPLLSITDMLLDLPDWETRVEREKEREERALEELEMEMEEEQKNIDQQYIIDRLNAENRNLRRTVFEMKNN